MDGVSPRCGTVEFSSHDPTRFIDQHPGKGSAHVGSDICGGRSCRAAVLQRPKLFGPIDLTQIVNAGISLCRLTRPDKVRNRNGGQETNDRNYDHDLHQREARFTGNVYFHNASRCIQVFGV